MWDDASLWDHRMIRTTLKEVAPKFVWIRNLRNSELVDFRNELETRMEDFNGRSDSSWDLDRTERKIRKVIMKVYENYPLRRINNVSKKLE